MDKFEAMLLNARALTTDQKMDELLEEASATKWDALLLNETWRGEAEEYDVLEKAHFWLGSGGEG